MWKIIHIIRWQSHFLLAGAVFIVASAKRTRQSLDRPAYAAGLVQRAPSTTEGETVRQALANLREATELFLEAFPLPPPDARS